MYKFRVPAHLVNLISTLHPELKKKLRRALNNIITDPFCGKSLKDELEGLRSLRVSRFRIIYRIEAKEIQIVAIGPRSNIYQETYRLIKKETPP